MLPFHGGETWRCDQGNSNDPGNIWGNYCYFDENGDGEVDCSDGVSDWKMQWSNPTHRAGSSMEYAWDFNFGSGDDDLGKPVVAPASGTIVYAQNSNSGWGNTVIIDYGDNTFGKIAHLARIDVADGDSVIQGQQIGTCGGTGGWTPHIHYQTQNDRYIISWSISSSFVDVSENNGIPLETGFYTSMNTYNPINNFRVGKYVNGFVMDDTSDIKPYSRPFPVTYFHNQGADMFGYPISDVYLLEDCLGCDILGADKVYVQDFQGGQTGYATLVMNMLTYNTRFEYLGVVYPIHGQIRDYWYLHFWELGAPVSNEHGYDGFDYCSGPGCDYVVQWFERSENNYVAVVYNDTNGTFQQYDELDSGAPPCTVLDQAKWDNLGCPGGVCGTGGGQDPPSPSDDYDINRSTTCKDVQSSDPWNPISETTLFYNDDNYVCSWIHLGNVYKSLNINWKWYNPNNILVSESSYTTSNPASYGYDYWDWYKSWGWLNINNANSYGQYHVDIYIDGQKVKTDYFTLTIDLSAPTGLNAEVISQSQIDLSWDAVSNASGYKVYRNNSTIATTADTSYSDTGLSSGTQYYYEITAYIDDNESDYSDWVYATTLSEGGDALATPTNIRVIELGENLIKIAWDEVENAVTYEVIKNDANTFFTGGDTTFTDQGVQPDETVNYKVWAFNSPVYSDGYAEINATSLPIGPFEASFTATPEFGPAPLTVEFVSTSTGGPTDFFWEILNNNLYFSSDAYAVHTFTEPGTYTVRLETYRYQMWSNAYKTIVVEEPLPDNPEPPDPNIWTLSDIGSPSYPGEALYYPGTDEYEVTGSGYDIWGSGAQFTILHQALNGNGEIIARITSQENTGGWAKAGVMIKESTDEYAPYAMMAITPDNGYAFQYNLDGHVGGGGYTLPNAWVKLTRNGDVLTGYISSDGQNWNQIGTYSISMQNSVIVGLFVTSNNGSELCTVTFDNVVVNNETSSLPTPLDGNWWISGGSMDNQNASADFHIASSPQNPWDNTFGTSYSVVAGNTYRLKFSARADNYTGDSMQIIAGINNNGPVSWYEISNNAMYYINGTEIEYVVDLIATETDTSANVYLNVGYDIGDLYFTYISLEEIEGNTNNISAPWTLVDIDNPSTVGTANYTASGSGPGMVTFDSSAQTSHTGEPSTATWNHTVGIGENALAVVCVSGLSEPSAPTWGGQSMILIDSESPTKCYYLLNPDTDTTTQVSVSGGNIKVGGSMVFFGVDQSDPIGAVATENGSTSPNEMFFTTEADGSMRVDILGANRDDAVSVAASLNSGIMRFDDVVPQNQFRISLFGYTTPQEVAGTATSEWITTGTSRKYLAFEIKAAVTAGSQYTLSGSGYDIWGSSGQYTLLHQTLNGDGEIIARITSQTNTSDWAKAGVIIVESTASNAQNAIMAVTPANGYAFQYNYYGHTGGGGYSFPNAWVKLVRSGDTITGYVSSDGNSWTYVSSVNIYMSANIQLGLFVASHDSNQVATVTFDNVNIVP